MKIKISADDHAIYEIRTKSGRKWFFRIPGLEIDTERSAGFPGWLVQFPTANPREEVQVLVSALDAIASIRRAEELGVQPGPMPASSPAERLKLHAFPLS